MAGEEALLDEAGQAPWRGKGVCQSVSPLAARMAGRSDAGATTNPSRRVASSVLENEPT